MTALPQTTPGPGLIRRLRLTQPVRFYCWPAIVVLLAVLVVPAVAAGAWLALVVDLPAVAFLVVAVEAARMSTLSPLEVAKAALDFHR